MGGTTSESAKHRCFRHVSGTFEPVMRTPVLDTDPVVDRDLDDRLPDLADVTPLTAVEVIAAPEHGNHPVAVYLARLAPGSRRTMRQVLDVVAAVLTDGGADEISLPWARLRYQHTQAVRSRLAERYQPASVNKGLAAVRGVLKEAWRLGLIPADDYHRAVDLRGITAHTLPRGRALSTGEIRALFTACAADQSPAGTRDAAMLALLYGAGMRRQEVVRLDVADFDPETGAVTIRSGKGRKDRTAYTTNGSLSALKAWVRVRGEEPGPLFVPVMKGGRLVLRRLVSHAIYKMVARGAPSRLVWRRSRRTTYAAPSSPTCSTRALTSPPSSNSLGTPPSRPPPGTTAAANTRSAGRWSCCTCPSRPETDRGKEGLIRTAYSRTLPGTDW